MSFSVSKFETGWCFQKTGSEHASQGVLANQGLAHFRPPCPHLVLDVHLAAVLVLRLAGEGVVDAELAGEALEAHVELVVVELGVGVGHARRVGVGVRGALQASDTQSQTGIFKLKRRTSIVIFTTQSN